MIRLASGVLTRQRMLRAALAVGIGAGILTVTFGAGYRSSATVLTDGSAYVQTHNTVSRVNAASAGVDARAARAMATGKQRLEVVQVSSGGVYVVNNATGDVYLLSTDTLDPQQVDKRPNAPARLQVTSGGGRTYLLDPGAGRVTLLPTQDGDGTRADVVTPAPIDQLVVDRSGTAWAYSSRTGDLYQIDGAQVRDQRHASQSGDRVSMTLCDGSPVLYDADTGDAIGYGPDNVPVNLAASDGVLAAPGVAPAVAVVAVPRTAEVVIGDLHSGDVHRIRLDGREGHSFGPPVVVNNRIYLPDYTAHQVVVLDLTNLALRDRIDVPGTSRTFEVFARDDRVWVNDPYADTLVTVDPSGQQTAVDKGTGGSGPGSSASPKPTTTPPDHPPTVPRTDPPNSPTTPKRVTVPNVIGKDRSSACAEVAARGLVCNPVAVSDGTGPAGVVVSTNPPAGTTKSSGDTVNVYYRRQALGSVPDVTGMAVSQACRTLLAVRPTSLRCVPQPSGLARSVAEVDRVVAQQPAPGAPVVAGTPVVLTYPALVQTPSAVGLPQANACGPITVAGLACRPIDLGSAAGTGKPAGVVVDQSPTAGTGADPNQLVTVKYYSNANVTVPSLVGQDPGSACAALRAANLACDPNDNEATQQTNVVHGQNPGPGTVVPAGTPVQYTYESTGPDATLLRFKAPAPRRANFLTTGDVGPPPGWSAQSSLGRVYTAGQGGVPGLIPIYRSCYLACGDPGTFYYSGNPNTQTNYVMQGEAFRCFDPAASAPSGTRPLHALFNGQVWVWAVPGSGEYATFTSVGFADRFTVCHIW